MLRSALTYGTFPAVVGGATIAGLFLLKHAEPDAVVGGLGLVCVLVIAALERVHSYVPEYNRSHDDVGTDIIHNLVSGIALPELTRVASFGALYWVGTVLSDGIGLQTWPVAWPLVAQLGLALMVAELPSYWFHRLQHRSAFWWRIHATHHSVPRMYWLNTARFHPLDGIASYAVLMFPVVLLGAPDRTLALLTVLLTAHGLLQHSNVALSHGPLSWIFSTAELHRWHHAPDPVDSNHNFGTVLAIWDVAFGTRYLPSDRKPPEQIGIGGMPNFPKGYLGQLASPFKWDRIGGTGPTAAPASPERIQ